MKMSKETNVGIIDNDSYSHLDDVLKTGLERDDVDRIRVAVGYLYMSGLKRLRPELDEFLENGGKLQILMGNQEQQGLEELVEAHQNLKLAGTKFRESSKVRWAERPEVRSETAENYSSQILYEDPSVDNQEFFTKLVGWLNEGKIETRLYLKERFHAKAYLFEKEEGLRIRGYRTIQSWREKTNPL
jgi:HKD family nuclease